MVRCEGSEAVAQLISAVLCRDDAVNPASKQWNQQIVNEPCHVYAQPVLYPWTALLPFATLVCICYLSLPTWLAAIGERNELCMSCHAEIDLIWMLRPATGTG
ncbi:hypothetical protein FPOAC2_00393 [Fusarium poae]|jgi:hypothetical protein